MNEFLIWFALGVLAEAIIASIYEAMTSASGVMKIDHSDPEKDVYLLEIDQIDNIHKKKFINLKIDHNADLSRKQQLVL